MTSTNSAETKSVGDSLVRLMPRGSLEIRSFHRITGDTQMHHVPFPFAVIGRAAGAGVRLDDPSVSQAHALLHLVDSTPYCLDLSSRTGLLWQDGPRNRGWVLPGDTVSVGNYDIRISVEGRTHTAEPGDEGHPVFSSFDVWSETEPSRRFTLEQPVTLVGRHPRCDVRLLAAAYFQCAIVNTREGVWCVDLLSQKGTALNGRFARVAQLQVGDLLEIGKVSLVFRGRIESSEPFEPVARRSDPTGVIFTPAVRQVTTDNGSLALLEHLLGDLQQHTVGLPQLLAVMREEHATEMRELRDSLHTLRQLLEQVACRSESNNREQELAGGAVREEQERVREALSRLEDEGKNSRGEFLSRTQSLQVELIEAREKQARSEALLAKAEEELSRERLKAAELARRLAAQAATGPRRSDKAPARESLAAPSPTELPRARTGGPGGPTSAGRKAPPPVDPLWEAVEATARPIRVGIEHPQKGQGVPVPAILKMLSSATAPSAAALQEAERLLSRTGLVGIIAACRGGDSAVRHGAARLCFHLARQAWQSGQPGDARVAAEHALRLLQQLLQENPGAAPVMVELAVTHMTLARWLRRQRDVAGAVRSLQVARDVSQQLVAKQPKAPPPRRALAMCLHDLGACLLESGKPADAAACVEQAIMHLQASAQGAPPSDRHAAELAQLHEFLKKCTAPVTHDESEPALEWAEAIVTPG